MDDGDDDGDLIMTLAVAGVIFVILLTVIFLIITLLIMGLLIFVPSPTIK